MTTKKKVKKSVSKKAKKTENLPAIKEHSLIEMNPQALVASAIKQSASIETINKLLDLAERIESKFAEKEFRAAMSAFQSECPIIKKTKIVKNKPEKGGGIRYRYAPIDTIVFQVQPFVKKNNFSYKIGTEITREPDGIRTTVTISHVAGYSEDTPFWVPIQEDAYMTEPQKWAAARTFGARYAFCDGFGILTGDEDNDAGDEKKKKDEQEHRKNEGLAKMDKLPDDIKEGFNLLGYTGKAIFTFCNKFEWNNQRIKAEINKILDAKG